MVSKSLGTPAVELTWVASLVGALLGQGSKRSAGGSRGIGCKSISFLNILSPKNEEVVAMGCRVQTWFFAIYISGFCQVDCLMLSSS